ncbi:FAD/NAD(P)-binding protein [Glarea lozoyensis ATCC 20868]|uniref:FAD/NAD(P)-binding protein n=1 Tax=Glarea lozoyensis (strain ATCC 20868 / MF5171) TaxID=1116229 RepID=S3D2G1_GLAL2|nr:FAD/NAD(P)-binding protein [Glarea lozoyensis ATCC 20868]EPE31319.1 FAD/NAD(P)-binding protein [Glarea lozoyensis ATCC 20868]
MTRYDNTNAIELTEVDMIVVGGGTSGCIIAGRIAKAQPDISIFVIEGGLDNRHDPTISKPILCSTHIKGESNFMSIYQAQRLPDTVNRDCFIKTAAVLGGGSSVNFCIYTRPSAADFDSFNADGWAFKDILPFMRKFETFHGYGNSRVHGYDGPVHISDGGFCVPRVESMIFESAARSGYDYIEDAQDPTELPSIGVAKWRRYASTDGVRQDTAHTYLHPLLDDNQHPNLHLALNTKVSRVIFDKYNCVIGVECYSDREILKVIATKRVILAAGTFGTPQILERSGIGSSRLLKSLAIPLVSELSQVGENYQDHPLISAAYKTSLKPGETLDGVLGSGKTLAHAIQTGDPILGWNGVDICFKLRPTEMEIANFSLAMQAAWEKDFQHVPDRPVIYLAVVSGFIGDRKAVPAGQYVCITSWLAHPYSRGKIHIASSHANDPPIFHSGFLSDPDNLDLEMLVWAYRKGHEIMRSFSFYDGEADVDGAAGLGHPDGIFLENGKLRADNGPIQDFVRRTVTSALHPLGTCRIGSGDLGVVNERLAVHAVGGLRCADLSICPNNLGTNTASVAMTVGEKAAAMILEDLIVPC